MDTIRICLFGNIRRIKRNEMNVIATKLNMNPKCFKNKKNLRDAIVDNYDVALICENTTDFASLEPIKSIEHLITWEQNNRLFGASAKSLLTLFRQGSFMNPYTIDFKTGINTNDFEYTKNFDLRHVFGLIENVHNICETNEIEPFTKDLTVSEYVQLVSECDDLFDKIKTTQVSSHGQYMYTNVLLNKVKDVGKGDACTLFAIVMRKLHIQLQHFSDENNDLVSSVIEQLHIGIRSIVLKSKNYYCLHAIKFVMETIYATLPKNLASEIIIHMINELDICLSTAHH